MYDEIIGTWLVWVGIGWFIIAGAAYLSRPARGDDTHRQMRADLDRDVAAFNCGCEDGNCFWDAARTESAGRHPAGKKLRTEDEL